jgi:hypothetical protein
MYWRKIAPVPPVDHDSNADEANSFDTGSFSKISASNISAVSPLNCGASSDESGPIFDDLILRLEDNLALIDEESLSLATYERKGNMNWDKFQEAVKAFAQERRQKKVMSNHPSENSVPDPDQLEEADDADSITELCSELVEEIESRNQSLGSEESKERCLSDAESNSSRTAQSTIQQ